MTLAGPLGAVGAFAGCGQYPPRVARNDRMASRAASVRSVDRALGHPAAETRLRLGRRRGRPGGRRPRLGGLPVSGSALPSESGRSLEARLAAGRGVPADRHRERGRDRASPGRAAGGPPLRTLGWPARSSDRGPGLARSSRAGNGTCQLGPRPHAGCPLPPAWRRGPPARAQNARGATRRLPPAGQPTAEPSIDDGDRRCTANYVGWITGRSIRRGNDPRPFLGAASSDQWCTR